MKYFILLFFLLISSLANANPMAVYEPYPWKKILPLVQEDLTIEVFEKYSIFQGKFKFAKPTNTENSPTLKLPFVFEEGMVIASNLLYHKKVSVRCGETELDWYGYGFDGKLSRLVKNVTGGLTNNVQVADYKMDSCRPSDIITIQYEQKNFSVGNDRAIIYIPILPGIHRRSEQFKITLINKTTTNLEIKSPKKFAKKVADPVTIYPLNQEVILAWLENVPVTTLPDYPGDERKVPIEPLPSTVSIDAIINFNKGQGHVPPTSIPKLDFATESLLKYVQWYPGLKVIIAGHTDKLEVGGDKLSILRAKAVEHYLIEKGIPEASLSTIGYAATRPIASSDTEKDRSKNRRVEFIIQR